MDEIVFTLEELYELEGALEERIDRCKKESKDVSQYERLLGKLLKKQRELHITSGLHYSYPTN